MEIAHFAWIGLLAACTVANLAASVLLARASLPLRLRKRIERVEAQSDELTALVAKMEQQSKLWDSTFEGYIEEAENAFKRAERKRASAASSLSKLNGGGNGQMPDVATMDRASIVDHLRRKHGGQG